VDAGPPFHLILASAYLFVDVRHVLLAEGAVVEPVVTHPAVNHGIHRHGNFQRGMRIDESHQRSEPVVGNAEDADFAVGFGNIFDEPVDGVVSVGGVIDGRWIQRPVQRAGHDVVAFGIVLAADILDDANVAVFDDDFGGVVVAPEGGAEMRAGFVADLSVGIVGRAGEENGGVFCALGDEDNGVELYAVAHEDHGVAAFVVEILGDGLEVGGGFTGKGAGVGLLRREV